ncbi:MAG: hypothetical protein OXP11_03190 [Gammaproteobacteria bacterium]|nr:hypothetical protein [Gammaproteobacteria bacterium]
MAERQGWRLVTTGTGKPPPLQLALDPAAVSGFWGDLARQFFEAGPEELPWPGKLWRLWKGDAAGQALLPAFRLRAPGDPAAPAFRVALPPVCGVGSRPGSASPLPP